MLGQLIRFTFETSDEFSGALFNVLGDFEAYGRRLRGVTGRDVSAFVLVGLRVGASGTVQELARLNVSRCFGNENNQG